MSAVTCAPPPCIMPCIPLYLLVPSPPHTHTLSLYIYIPPPSTISPCTYLVEVSKWFFVSHKHLGKFSALVRVDPHHVAKKKDVVRCVADFLCIQDDLLKLACLCKTLDHLQAKEDTTSQRLGWLIKCCYTPFLAHQL